MDQKSAEYESALKALSEELARERALNAELKQQLAGLQDEQVKRRKVDAAKDETRDAAAEPAASAACCFCKGPLGKFGNSPAPAATTGKCCDVCNFTVVIPARVDLMQKVRRDA